MFRVKNGVDYMEENSVDLLSRILDEAKQEKPPKKRMAKLWIVFLAISIFLLAACIFFAASNQNDYKELQEQVEILKKRYQTASNARDKFMEQAESMEDELDFWRKNAVIVTKEGEKYHTFNCKYVVDKEVTIIYYKTAENAGYTPCSVCLPNGLGGHLIKISGD